MKKQLKSMASSLKTLAQVQSRIAMEAMDSVVIQRQSHELSAEIRDLYRLSTDILATRFQLELHPMAKMLRELVALVPSDLGRQQAVEEAKRILEVIEATNLRQPR